MQVQLLLCQLTKMVIIYPILRRATGDTYCTLCTGFLAVGVVVIDDLRIRTVEAYAVVVMIMTSCYSLVDWYQCF
jgi:hypothetical protein